MKDYGAAGENVLTVMGADLRTNDPGFDTRSNAWTAWIGATDRGVWILQWHLTLVTLGGLVGRQAADLRCCVGVGAGSRTNRVARRVWLWRSFGGLVPLLGATGIQIAEYVEGRRQRILKHIGSAHTEAELGLLIE